MIKTHVCAISKINDFVILKLPNGDYAPMETTEKLKLSDILLFSDISLGDNSFTFNKNSIGFGFIEDYCSLEIALQFLYV